MFVVQVNFKDGSPLESLFIRRLYLTVGKDESCHLILDGMSELEFKIIISRHLGNTFKCKAMFSDRRKGEPHPWEKEYQGIGEIDLGYLQLNIFCISAQVGSFETSFETEGYNPFDFIKRIMKSDRGRFPALLSLSEPRVALSMEGINQLEIGNSRACDFRIDGFLDKQSKAKVYANGADGYELVNLAPEEELIVNGGVLVDHIRLESRDKIKFKAGPELIYLEEEKDLNALSEELPDIFFSSGRESKRNIRALNGPIRPKLLPIKTGQTISVGRDAAHNIWVDAVFISRLHCTIHVKQDGYLITDYSTNGVQVDGQNLEKGKPVFFPLSTLELHLGNDSSILLSELDDTGFFNLGPSAAESTEDLVNKREEKNYKPLVTGGIEESPVLDQSFADFQRRSIRVQDNVDLQIPMQTVGDWVQNEMIESPVRIGVIKYLPQVFIGILIISILAFFIILGLNLVR